MTDLGYIVLVVLNVAAAIFAFSAIYVLGKDVYQDIRQERNIRK